MYGQSASGTPILGMVDREGRHVVAKGETVEACLEALCRHRRVTLPAPPPPAAVVTISTEQWERFLKGKGPWTEDPPAGPQGRIVG